MLKTKIGIEVEFTGITRTTAIEVVARVLNGTILSRGDTPQVKGQDGRTWKVTYDGSIIRQRKSNGETIEASQEYSCELVSPILKYNEDIETFQEIIRELRKAGAFTNGSCGIHIHLDGKKHTAKTITNFINIVASKNDLLYKALKVKSSRMHWCKKMDENLVTRINQKKPKTLKEVENIWYNGASEYSRTGKYNDTRYHFLNLHSFFNGHGTVEIRGFNSEMHAGKIRAYILLCLALNNQAMNQKQALRKKPQDENEKFAMRTYLNRIGFIGEDYKNPRKFLTEALQGSSAWRF